ncbi:hypothetical protein B9Z19DRAFT_1102864 [Tuber borchii]|uniref:C3H1-type domain-containing protein n=1 Tax=Tuber borchii TaxID=42251 RepID=A0A2T6ZJL7_TUBBO|nr:hypothetical protein B9Z19DRAFT_1102864 [Tuber borchii]
MDPEVAAKRLEFLKDANKDSIGFIEELLEENKSLSKQLSDLKIGYNGLLEMCRDREAILSKIKEAESRLSKNGYIIVLVDGDGMIFTEELLAKGKSGGSEAGKLLIQALTEEFEAESTREVHVMIFVNMYKLGSILQVSGRVKEPKNFKDFAAGFIQAREHLYFIDVGDGKEMVDSRIRAELSWHLQNYNCQKVVLGASHDNGYVRVLNSIAATTHESKVFLLEGPPFASEFHSLPFNKLKFPHIFDSRKLDVPRPPPGLPGPSRLVEPPAPYPSYATVAVASPPGTTSKAATMVQIGLMNRSNVTPQQKAAMTRIKTLQPPPCNDHYLLGVCWKEVCHFSHKYNLTALEVEAMQSRVGATRCEYGAGCRNENCYRGHSCVSLRDNKCTRPNCPFLESEHPEGAFVSRWPR